MRSGTTARPTTTSSVTDSSSMAGTTAGASIQNKEKTMRTTKTWRRGIAALAVFSSTVAILGAGAAAHATSSVGGQITPSEMLSRAQYWVDRHVPYNQGAYSADPQGTTYREDCSGYVSMAWHLGTSLVVTDGGPSFTNSDGSPNGTYDTGIGSFSNLQTGDAMAYPHDHIWLFDTWTDKANGDFTYYAESNPSDPTHGPTNANINSTTLEGWPKSGYVGLRYKNVVPDGSGGHTGPYALPGGGWQAMWHGADTSTPTGSLWTAPGRGNGTTGAAVDPRLLGVAPGTTASMAVLPDGSWVAAWHGADTTNPKGSLWIATGSGTTVNAVAEPGNLGVAAGTSPSIVALADGSWVVAWHGADTINAGGSLWVAPGRGTGLTAAAAAPGNLGVAPNSSPSIVTMPDGSWTAAWHGADTVTPTGSLWVVPGRGTGLTAAAARPGNLGVAGNTSPSLTAMPDGTWVTAWHGADTINPSGSLWIVPGHGTSLSSAAAAPGNLGVASNTSPAIVTMPDGSWTAAWHGADTINPGGSLWVAPGHGTSLNAPAAAPGNLGVASGSSPTLVP
jgi:hypothetical protein